jgi:hypothetical protein
MNFVIVLYQMRNGAASGSRPSVVGLPDVGRACIQCGCGCRAKQHPVRFPSVHVMNKKVLTRRHGIFPVLRCGHCYAYT